VHLEDDMGGSSNTNVAVALVDTTPAVVSGPGDFGVQVGTGFNIAGTIADGNVDIVTGTGVTVTLEYFNTTGGFTSMGLPSDPMTIFGIGGGEEPGHALATWPYTFAVPAGDVALPGTLTYWVNVTGPNALGASYGPYDVTAGAGATPPPTPHPFFGYVKDGAGAGQNGAAVSLEYVSGGVAYTFNTVSANDALGNPGYYQMDVLWWNTSDSAGLNATLGAQLGTNVTYFDMGDNVYPDDDREYVNITLVDACPLWLEVGWNLVSTQCLRDVGLNGLAPYTASDLVADHFADTQFSLVNGWDANLTVVSWNGAGYDTYVGGFGGVDFQFSPNQAADHDYAFFAYATEAWDDDGDATPVLISGTYPSDVFVGNRVYTLAVGWNMVGWTSDNAGADYDAIAIASFSVAPEVITNWTIATQSYASFIILDGAIVTPGTGSNTGPGYGMWVYVRAASDFTYPYA
jgi:hypothetical protein